MLVMFCGHREVAQSETVRNWLVEVTERLIQGGADVFYLGGYGGFDKLAAAVLRTQKKRHPSIQLILVVAYLNTGMDTSGYDNTIYPSLENVPKRFAISKRNERMIDASDIVVAYVTHGWGGAATTLQYAERKRKVIIQYPDKASGIV